MLCFAGKERVTGSAEALEDLHVHLLWGKANGLPFSLESDDLLSVAVPVSTAFVLFFQDFLLFHRERSSWPSSLLHEHEDSQSAADDAY